MTERSKYGTVVRERLCEQVATQLQDLVLGGELTAGDRLPPEQELCTIFGVSRTVVREAVKMLSERGLVDIRHGRGTFVSSFDNEATADSIGMLLHRGGASIDDLSEVRHLLEVGIAGLAAKRIGPGGLAILEESVAMMEGSVDSPEDYMAADKEFHQALAEASGNTVFLVLLNSIEDLLSECRRTTLSVPDSAQRAIERHRGIVAAMRAGDSHWARKAMSDHMNQVDKEVQAAAKPSGE